MEVPQTEARIDIHSLFQRVGVDGTPVVQIRGAQRRRLISKSWEALLDDFDESTARCLFLRYKGDEPIRLFLGGDYRMTTAQGGGWLLHAAKEELSSFWLPLQPLRRRVDDHGRILRDFPCPLRSFDVSARGIEVGLEHVTDSVLDIVLWQIEPRRAKLAAELSHLEVAERQPVFLWGSHATYRRPADLYNALIHGRVFDQRFAWPFKRQSFSENEAHSLHLAVRNRELQSGKTLYGYLRKQLMLSLLARQDEDGAWRHGIWTENMECHFRLHCSAVHMLMDHLCVGSEEVVADALTRAVQFIVDQAVTVAGETWFLHDSLEQSSTAASTSPSRVYTCTSLDKASSNSLVLNTHIDTLVALQRYQTLTGTNSLNDEIESARRVLHRLTAARPAEWLYRPLFRAIYLTLLPLERATSLPLPVRALKRIARNQLVSLLPWVKCRYPRFAMPGGYIDRALTAGGLAHSYHGINLMDLARYRERFPEDRDLDGIVADAMRFAEDYDLTDYWAENARSRYAIGFWIEALYRMCLRDDSWKLREYLARALMKAAAIGIGRPPSLDGRNCEAVPPQDQVACATTQDHRLWVANLGTRSRWEMLAINLGTEKCVPALQGECPAQLSWRRSWAPDQVSSEPARLPSGTWVQVTGSTSE